MQRTDCRLCGSRRLVKFLDFDNVLLAGAFLRAEDIRAEPFYPLGIYFCEDCTCVQVCEVIPGDVLFRNYFYFSSAIRTLVEQFGDFAPEMAERFALGSRSLVVELGCNDGVILRPLSEREKRCVGVDPATNVASTIKDAGISVVNDGSTDAMADIFKPLALEYTTVIVLTHERNTGAGSALRRGIVQAVAEREAKSKGLQYIE